MTTSKTFQQRLTHVFWGYALIGALFSAHSFAGADAAPAPQPDLIAGMTPAEALRLGEKMYREGILPSGEPMQALVKGDIPVDGTMFTCVSCHLRSGFGSMEGTIRTAPIDGTRLYSPLSKYRGAPLVGRAAATAKENLLRPAYTDESLGKLLLTGVDPAGRQLDTAMPCYFLNDRDKEIMVYYLKNLSVGREPGVTDTTLRFATVVTEDVPPADRDAMVGPLQLFIKNWRVPKAMERGMRSSIYRLEGGMKELRSLELAVWELKGPAETWRGQLEEYYRKDPVFALLGGITTGEWTPIHRFSEDHRIPSIFPITDHPALSENDWYTFYLSKGLHQEAEAAAKFIHGRTDLPQEVSVVQVYRRDRAGFAISKAFEETWLGLGRKAPVNISLELKEPLSPRFWKKLGDNRRHAVVLLWLNSADFPALDKLGSVPVIAMASSTLLGQGLYTLPEKERRILYITYPYALPQDSVIPGAQGRLPLPADRPAARPDITLKMRSLFATISNPLSRMRSFVYRDYFLELIEITPDIKTGPILYPRLSFGAGQRYASKGCYVVQLSEGRNPELIKRSEWVMH